ALEPPVTNLATVDAALTSSTHRWQCLRAELRAVAELEHILLQVAQRREDLAAELSWTTMELVAHLGSDEQTARWQRRAQRYVRPGLSAGWRRHRLRRARGHGGEPTAAPCQPVAAAAAVQQHWSALRRRYTQVRSDAALADDLTQAEQDLRERSATVVDA